MAIIRTGPIVGAISGSIGGVTFVVGSRAAVVRPRPTRRPRVSSFKRTSDSLFANIRHSWADLTDLQQSGWNVLGPTLSRVNRLGQTSPLNGFEAFVRVNMELRNEPGDLVEEAPVVGVGPPPRAVSADLQEVGNFTVSASPPLGFLSAVFFVYAWTYFTDHAVRDAPRLVFLLEKAAPSITEDIRDEWEAHFGTPVEGQQYRIGVATSTFGTPRSQITRVSGSIAA